MLLPFVGVRRTGTANRRRSYKHRLFLAINLGIDVTVLEAYYMELHTL